MNRLRFYASMTPLEQAELAATIAWQEMHKARRSTHASRWISGLDAGLAIGYRFALLHALAMRRQLRVPRIARRRLEIEQQAWQQLADGTLVRVEPDRFTPAWIEQHRPQSPLVITGRADVGDGGGPGWAEVSAEL